MSKKNTRFTTSLSDARTKLDTIITEHGTVATDGVVAGTYSAESFDTFETQSENQLGSIRTEVMDIMRDVIAADDLSTEGFDENSEHMKAGMIAYLGSQDPIKYHESAMKSGGEGMSLESISSGVGGVIDTVDGDFYSQESFDGSVSRDYAAQNILYNVMASRQDSYAEAHFPTKVITAAEGGISVIVDRQEIIRNATHPTDGGQLNNNRTNLLDAFHDHTILAQPATDLVPYVRDDGSNSDSFVPESMISNTVRDVMGNSVTTRPLSVGNRINLLGLSQHPGTINNDVMDGTDQVAHGIELRDLYLRLYEDDGTNQTTEIIPFRVKMMPRVQFRKSHEGSGNEVTLSAPLESLTLSPSTETISGASPSLIQTTIVGANVTVQFAVTMTGHGNLNEGNFEVNAGSIKVLAAYDSAGESLSLTEGAGLDAKNRIEALDAKIVGYTLDARRTNSNWRSTGPLIDTTPYSEKYAVEPGYPISVLSPTEDDSKVGNKISGMINAARIRNSNNAITTMLNYAEQLNAHKQAMAAGVKLDILGAGRYIVTPYYNEDTIDVNSRTETIRSQDRFDDVSHVLVDAIRSVAYEMYRDSNYGPALEISTSGTDTKPVVLIGCDAVIERYLNVKGDSRLLGDGMEARVVSTNDDRMSGKITVTFTREMPGSEDGLGFGVHAYVPELIQRVTTTVNGRTVRNDRVIPRSLHVPVLPVMSVLSVTGLKDATAHVPAS